MQELQERVQRMLDGEKKRREVALKWLEQLTAIIAPVGEDVWGTGEDENGMYTIDIVRTNGKNTAVYFRYEEWDTMNHDETEVPGFYWKYDSMNSNYWMTPLFKLRGREFWYCVQVILEWIPQVMQAMEKREISREALLEKINL